MAQSVVKHDQHILNGATPHASFELLDNAENTSKTIQITGLTAQSTEDSIRNYFENERRSGGGEVEAVTFLLEENVALVTFKDVEGEFLTVSSCNFFFFAFVRGVREVRKRCEGRRAKRLTLLAPERESYCRCLDFSDG